MVKDFRNGFVPLDRWYFYAYSVFPLTDWIVSQMSDIGPYTGRFVWNPGQRRLETHSADVAAFLKTNHTNFLMSCTKERMGKPSARLLYREAPTDSNNRRRMRINKPLLVTKSLMQYLEETSTNANNRRAKFGAIIKSFADAFYCRKNDIAERDGAIQPLETAVAPETLRTAAAEEAEFATTQRADIDLALQIKATQRERRVKQVSDKMASRLQPQSISSPIEPEVIQPQLISTTPTRHWLVLADTPVRDRGEMLNLTDMWKAAKRDPSKAPHEWSRKEGSDFIDFLSGNLNTPKERIYQGERGAGGGTWAHWQIALAYAKYLSPEFHMACNDVVRSHMAGTHIAPQQNNSVLALMKDMMDRQDRRDERFLEQMSRRDEKFLAILAQSITAKQAPESQKAPPTQSWPGGLHSLTYFVDSQPDISLAWFQRFLSREGHLSDGMGPGYIEKVDGRWICTKRAEQDTPRLLVNVQGLVVIAGKDRQYAALTRAGIKHFANHLLQMRKSGPLMQSSSKQPSFELDDEDNDEESSS